MFNLFGAPQQQMAANDPIDAMARSYMAADPYLSMEAARAMATSNVQAQGAQAQGAQAMMANQPLIGRGTYDPAAFDTMAQYGNPMAAPEYGSAQALSVPSVSSGGEGERKLAGQVDLEDASSGINAGDVLNIANSLISARQDAINEQEQEMLRNAPTAELIQGRYQPRGQQQYSLLNGLQPLGGLASLI